MFSLAISSICDCWRSPSSRIAAATSGSASNKESRKNPRACSANRGDAGEIAREHLSGTEGASRETPVSYHLPYLGCGCQPATINRVRAAFERNPIAGSLASFVKPAISQAQQLTCCTIDRPIHKACRSIPWPRQVLAKRLIGYYCSLARVSVDSPKSLCDYDATMT